MSIKPFPNIWQSAFLTIFLVVALSVFYVIVFFILDLLEIAIGIDLQSFIFFISAFLLIPFIAFGYRKSGVNILEQIFMPKPIMVLVVIILAVSLELIVNPLLLNPVGFFQNIRDGRIEIIDFKALELSYSAIFSIVHGVILAPVFEEIFFRGLILSQLLKTHTPIIAIGTSALLFSVAHMQVEGVFAIFVSGVLFSIIYCKTRSLSLVILLHSFSNLFQTFITTNKVDITNTLTIVFLVIFVSGVLVFISTLHYLFRLNIHHNYK